MSREVGRHVVQERVLSRENVADRWNVAQECVLCKRNVGGRLHGICQECCSVECCPEELLQKVTQTIKSV